MAMKRLVYAFIAVLPVLLQLTPVVFMVEGASDPSFLVAPYVMFVDPATEKLRFETCVNTSFTLDYGLTQAYGERLSNSTLDIMHEASITGLTPNTTYYYKVTVEGEEGQTACFNSTFTTSMDYGLESNFVFVVMGDSRAASGDGVDTQVFQKLINQAVRSHSPRFIAMTGDVVTTSGNDYDIISEAWGTYLRAVENISENTPIFNALGNHEHITPSTLNALKRYREIWMHPRNGGGEEGYADELTFWFEYGNSLFIFVNTEEPSYSPRIQADQLVWLNNTLQKPGYTHKFVFFHKPVCGTLRGGTVSGSYPADSALLDRMFSRCNVTVSFAGHNHYYCYNTSKSGTTYVITGGAGAPLHSTEEALGSVKHSEHHYVVVEVAGQMVNVTVVNMDDVVKHSFIIPELHPVLTATFLIAALFTVILRRLPREKRRQPAPRTG